MSHTTDNTLIQKLNNSVVLAKTIKEATDDTYKYRLKDIDIVNFNKMIKHNTVRKRNTRKKYDCILESDIPYLTDIFNKMRVFFYGIPLVPDKTFVTGGLYMNCLPPRGHKTFKIYLFNFRCSKDKEYVGDIEKLLKSHGFLVYCD